MAGWLSRFVPTAHLWLTLGPAAVVATAIVGALAAWLRVAAGLATPYTRKIFHITIFTLAAGVHLRWGLQGVVVFGAVVSAAVVLAVVRGDGSPLYEALARTTDRPHRTLFILVPLLTTALGGLTANLLFPTTAPIGYLVAGWGDAIAEPVGTRWGRHRYRVPSLAGVPATRSIEGSLAVLLLGAAAALLVLRLHGVATGHALLAATACGLAGAIVEALSSHGVDNFTVQVAAAAVAFVLG